MEAKYQRIKLIGKGSFGKAFLVKNTEMDKLCVVKQMDTGLMSEEERKKSVMEALVLKKLQHPNIISFQEVFMTRKGRLCIVMDYADGGDLHSAIYKQKGGLLPEATVLEWFVQICFAMMHVHDRKILHRDLKTQNIFLMASGQIKLGDFGIATVLETCKGYAKTMVGTPYYLSPEIIQERPYAFKSDVWSCGIVLYELATLQHPFDADSIVILAGKIVRDEIPDPDEVYTSDLRALIHRMLNKNENARPSIRQVLQTRFLLDPMTQANEKFKLGLDLAEFAEVMDGEMEEFSGRPTTTGTVGVAGDDEHFDAGSESSDSDGANEAPANVLSRSVKALRLSDEQDSGNPSSLRARAQALRGFLAGQTTDEGFDRAMELVRAAASEAGSGKAPATESLRQDVGEALGDAEKAALLVPMFQLLCFLEDISTSVLKESIVDKFRKWDINGDGVISPEELHGVLKQLGMADATIERTFSAIDANADGKIDYREFVDWLYSGTEPRSGNENRSGDENRNGDENRTGNETQKVSA